MRAIDRIHPEDRIKPNVAIRQRVAEAGRLAVLASTILGFVFAAPQVLTAQTRESHQHKTVTTRQAFEHAGKLFAGPALEEWAAEAEDDDLETVLDAAQMLDADRLETYLAEEYGVRLAPEASRLLVRELRYFKRFSVMMPRLRRSAKRPKHLLTMESA